MSVTMPPAEPAPSAAESRLLERFERFLEIAGTASSDLAQRDELRRRVLMQLDCEDAASRRAVSRLAAHVDETLAVYPAAAVMADWETPWPSPERGCDDRRVTPAPDVR